MKINTIDWLAMALVIVGGLNWGLIGFFDYNLVASIFGDATTITRAIYGLVGISALYMFLTATKVSSGARAKVMERQ